MRGGSEQWPVPVIAVLVVVCNYYSIIVQGHSHLQPHHYEARLLQPFSGQQLSYSITARDKKSLSQGKSVIIRENILDQGDNYQLHERAMIIQDIKAPPALCLDNILDIGKYSQMVSLVKKLDIYDRIELENGTDVTFAEFEVGVLSLRLGYYLKLSFHPMYNTMTWTLDYSRDSDFDDNIGHWQVMPHPHHADWCRVLYSTEVILPNWIPAFALKLIENSALSEATGWLRRESEREFNKENNKWSSDKKFKSILYEYIDDPKGGAKYVPCEPVFEGDKSCSLRRKPPSNVGKINEKILNSDQENYERRINKIRIRHVEL